MHLKFGYFVLYTPIYRVTERKNKTFPRTKLPMRNGRCENRLCTRVLRAWQSSCRFWQESIPRWLSIMKNMHNRTRSSVFMHTQPPSVTIQGNITATRYRNDVIRSVLLLHIRAKLGMMLTGDYVSCHAARSTLVMFVANNMQKLRWPVKVWI